MSRFSLYELKAMWDRCGIQGHSRELYFPPGVEAGGTQLMKKAGNNCLGIERIFISGAALPETDTGFWVELPH